MIKDSLQERIKEALKSKDAIRASTLRLLLSGLNYELIAKQHGLSEEEELAVVRRQLKQREEAVESYEKGGRPESAKKERQEAEILKEFLPAQLSEQEVSELVDRLIGELGASGTQDFGKVMSAVMAKTAGRADGKVVAEIVKQELTD